MTNKSKLLPTVLFSLLLSIGLFAQKEKETESAFNKYEAFSPLFMTEMANSFNSATGNPGPNYWQNQANYDIEATLDTLNHKIKGSVTITYANHSPYSLDYLWLQMDQNSFREDSRSKALYPADDRNGVRTPTEGFELSRVEVNGKTADYLVNDSRLQIRLATPLSSKDGKAQITIDYSYTIPTHGKDRTGRVKTKNGWIYTIAQWYPRMAVFDEVEGWNNIPYLGTGEFYLEYGDFNYEITAPENMLVVGSGVLQNPKKVLPKEQLKRLEEASKSDETITLLSKDEMLAGTHHAKGNKGMLTWEFKMNNSRDVAWAASKAFIWDAARINLPNGKKALAQSVYPEENSGQDGYGRSTEYTKHSIEINSKNWYPYPYEVATNVGGHEGGMEYPGLVFCSYESQNEDLWGVINHEFGHTWFPMIVGSNERVYGWLDEGLNTFINDIADQEFNNGEYAGDQRFQAMGSVLFNDQMDPLFTRADVIHDQYNLAYEAYYKPAYALHVLRNVVLGKDRFDYAFQNYIKTWAYKHPQPWDFFNAMSNASGEDLGWFFKGWFMRNWKNDQGIEEVDYVGGDPAKGALITLKNYGEMAMPVDLEVTFEDGSSHRKKLPVEIWMTGSKYIYHMESDKKIKEVEIDPDHLVPDANPGNNSYKKLAAAPADQNVKTILTSYLNAIGGKDNLEGIKDLWKEAEATIQGTALTFIKATKAPDKYLQEVQAYGNTLQKITINGEEIHLFSQGKEQEINSEEKEQIKTLLNEEDYIELHLNEEGYNFEVLGVDTLEGDSVYVVQARTPEGQLSKHFYSTESGLKVGVEDATGKRTTYADYKEVKGVKLPFETTQNINGTPTKMVVKEIKINEGLPDSTFN